MNEKLYPFVSFADSSLRDCIRSMNDCQKCDENINKMLKEVVSFNISRNNIYLISRFYQEKFKRIQ